MATDEFERLATMGQLRREPFDEREFDALVRSGRARLKDARKAVLSLESRFDLAYNAAHALSLAALRRKGYRSENRYIVFQLLPLTTGVPTSVWRILAKCHGIRNTAEYEGIIDLDDRLVLSLIDSAERVSDALR